MRIAALAVLLLLVAVGFAQARCADDIAELRTRMAARPQKPVSAQTAAALKELKRADDDLKNLSELDCLNDVARARRALRAPDAPAAGKARNAKGR